LRTLALDRPGVSVKRPWQFPGDVRTVHLGTYSPEHDAEICCLLEENDIVCWAKTPSGFTNLYEIVPL
jgi:hypothetical protein